MKHDKVDAIQRLIDARGYKFSIVHDADGSTAEAFCELRFKPVALPLDCNAQLLKIYTGDYDTYEFSDDLPKYLSPTQI
ncbi:TlpA family protein disulfide reductase [Oligella ureolytica]